jgi:3-hydroxyacyl-CoA dehydrogenase/enoyl-CoA hydratase/3-hydroxybutyryl-CoA epimerase
MQAIYKVAVIGGGAMGQGIAALVARQGIPVVIKEINDELAGKARAKVQHKFDAWVAKGKMLADQAEDKKMLVQCTCNYEDIADVDLVIEAVYESMEVKTKVFAELDQQLPGDVIFATNTSALSITEMAAATKRRAKIAGVHFFNPPTAMALVEIISGEGSSKKTIDTLEDFARNSLGKVPIRVKECPGFLVNRLLMPYLNEASLLLSETDLTVEDIERQTNNFGWPMGPFTLLDFLGIDVAAEVARILEKGYGERLKAAPLMNILVKHGRHGQKSGAGFFVVDETQRHEPLTAIINREFPKREKLPAEQGFRRMMLGMINEAFICLGDRIASPEDIETGCKYGIGFPHALEGPLHWAQSQGLSKILDELRRLEKTRGPRFKPSHELESHVKSGKPVFSEKEAW